MLVIPGHPGEVRWSGLTWDMGRWPVRVECSHGCCYAGWGNEGEVVDSCGP